MREYYAEPMPDPSWCRAIPRKPADRCDRARCSDQDAPRIEAASAGDCRPDEVGPDGYSLAREPPRAGHRPGTKGHCRRGRSSTGRFSRSPIRHLLWSKESMAPDFGRSVHPREARSQGYFTFTAGRQADLDPPRDVRPDGPAADARGGRRRSRPTPLPVHSIGWSTGCWLRPATASDGDGTGSTWRVMPTPRDTSCFRTRITTGPTPTATTSSAPSIETCPTTDFWSSRSRPTGFPPSRAKDR